MHQGMLNIEDDGRLVLIEFQEDRRTVIEPGSTLEIRLGNCWIVGIFRPDYDEQGHMEQPYHLFIEQGNTFCGIVSGMVGRISGSSPAQRRSPADT